MEQLASDKIEICVGGIYILERISRESPDDYWTVMETLSTFVRERTSFKSPSDFRPAIVTALTVIARRDKKNQKRESNKGWRLDLSGADLRSAKLSGACLVEGNLSGVYLFEVDLSGANLSRADLRDTKFEGANLSNTNLAGANLHGADLSKAKGLLQQQLLHASGDARTRLPDDVARPRPLAGGRVREPIDTRPARRS